MHDEMNLCMMRTRSYESELFIAFPHPVQSLVTGPRGNVVCNSRAGNDDFAIVQVDLSEKDTVRSGASAHLRDRRPGAYLP
jgi:hypothetical protein